MNFARLVEAPSGRNGLLSIKVAHRLTHCVSEAALLNCFVFVQTWLVFVLHRDFLLAEEEVAIIDLL